MRDPTFSSARELAAAIRKGRASAREVLDCASRADGESERDAKRGREPRYRAGA